MRTFSTAFKIHRSNCVLTFTIVAGLEHSAARSLEEDNRLRILYYNLILSPKGHVFRGNEAEIIRLTTFGLQDSKNCIAVECL